MAFTQEQKDLLVGTLLGDASLGTETKGRTWRYRVLHKAEHEQYINHKYSLLKDYCLSEPKPNDVYNKRTKNVYRRLYFNTRVHPSFRFFGNMFYTYDPKTGQMVKDVPLEIEKFLTPAAVAYWYMDDGSLKQKGKSNAMRICTESFSIHGVLRLERALNNLYGIRASHVKKNKIVNGKTVLVGLRITINEKESTAFRELIRPYLVDCMKYKVSDGNRGHL